MMKRFFLLSVVLLIAVGCGENDPPPLPPATPLATPITPAPVPQATVAKPVDTPKPDEKKPEAGAPAADKPAETVEQPGIVVGKAEVGVGAKGHYSEGIITTPVSVIFRSQEMIAFKIQIPQAMNLYKAEHNNRGPKTHEEYMEKIIKANMIALPELREGQRFLYDPKTEQLMVEEKTQ